MGGEGLPGSGRGSDTSGPIAPPEESFDAALYGREAVGQCLHPGTE